MKRKFIARPGRGIVAGKVIASTNTLIYEAAHCDDADMLYTLSDNSDYKVRLEVAGNASAPSEVLRKLSRDSNKWVRLEVAANLNTPSDVLERLALDDEYEVKEQVSMNPNFKYRDTSNKSYYNTQVHVRDMD